MNRDEVLEVVSGLSPGTQLKLTYRWKAVEEVGYLWVLMNAGVIESPDDELYIQGVTGSSSWGSYPDANVILVTTTGSFDVEAFAVERIYKALKKIEVLQAEGA